MGYFVCQVFFYVNFVYIQQLIKLEVKMTEKRLLEERKN